MRTAMARAELGDDVYGEDPTVNRLEEMASGLLGAEAAVFVASGTMANLLALMTHCPRGRKILVGDRSDVWLWEAGGAAVLGGLIYHTVPTQPDGELAIADLAATFQDETDPQCAPAGLLCLEDTHCMTGGQVLSLEYLAHVRDFADERGLPIHLDGSRLFNAAVAQGIGARDIARHADSVCFCLSKGLCAPVGSMVAGRRGFIAAVRRLRKMVGGGLRQAGVLAAAGIYALEHMVERLAEDHTHARLLADALATVPGIRLDPQPPRTNIVFWRLDDPRRPVAGFLHDLEAAGVRTLELEPGRIRAVTHHGITAADVERAVQVIRQAATRHSPTPAGTAL
jgi:threonine aldolase